LINLKDVSLVAVATQDVKETVAAIEYSLKGIDFARVQLFAHYNPKPESRDYEFIKINNFSSVGEWGKFIIYDLYKFITTKHIVLIHADGFVVNPESWDNIFLKYDYIGAPWPLPKDNFSFRDYYGNIIRHGNSVSLRSYKILKLPSELNLDWDANAGYFHEDGFLCTVKRHILIKNDIEFAPLDIACKFSHETPIPEIKGIKPFAFHKWAGENKQYPKFGRYSASLLDKIITWIKKRGGYGKNN
jgi:hypothetical protein